MSTTITPEPAPMSAQMEQFVKEQIEVRLHQVVRSEVAREEEERFRQLRWLAAIVGLIGLGTFGTLASYVIEKTVDSRIEDKAGQISKAMGFIKFYTITLKLDLGTSFSQEDQDVIMSYLRKAAADNELRNSKEFHAALFQVTKAFASASQNASIDEIVSLFANEILNSPALVEALLHHYGQDIVTRSIKPVSDLSNETFEKLERVAKDVQELALFYRIFFTYRGATATPDPEVQRLFQLTANLAERDKARFWQELLQRTRASNWQRNATPEGLFFEAMTRRFLSDYRNVINNHFNFPEALLESVVSDGMEEEGVASLASFLAESSLDNAAQPGAAVDRP